MAARPSLTVLCIYMFLMLASRNLFKVLGRGCWGAGALVCFFSIKYVRLQQRLVRSLCSRTAVPVGE